MFNSGSFIDCADNSGVLRIKCIKVLNKSPKQSTAGRIGNFFVGVTFLRKGIKFKKKFSKSKLSYGIFVGGRFNASLLKKSGIQVSFFKNRAVTVSNTDFPNLRPQFTRAKTPFLPSLKSFGFSKLYSFSSSYLL